MKSTEVQYELDRNGYVVIDDASDFDEPIQLGHLTGRISIKQNKNNQITGSGIADTRALFEYNYLDSYSHDPPEIYFENVVSGNSDNNTFFRVVQPNTAPRRLVVKRCVMRGIGGWYAIDAKSAGPCECVHIEDCLQTGGGFIRWRCNSKTDCKSFRVRSSRKQGTDRVGPTIDLKNVRDFFVQLIIDENNIGLLSGLNGVYAGPTAFRVVNPYGRCEVDDYWFEPSGTFDTDAEDCWSISVHSDDTTGNYGQNHLVFRTFQVASSASATGVPAFYVGGGGSSANATSIFVDLQDFWDSDSTQFAFGGKVRVALDRASRLDASLSTIIEGFVSGDVNDALSIPNSSTLPAPADDTNIVWDQTPDSEWETNYRDEEAQWDD